MIKYLQTLQPNKIKMSANNSDPHPLDLGMIIDKIPTKAFLKSSQSLAAEESDWGTVKVGIVCAYVVYRGREKGRKIKNFHSGDMAFQVYQL